MIIFVVKSVSEFLNIYKVSPPNSVPVFFLSLDVKFLGISSRVISVLDDGH